MATLQQINFLYSNSALIEFRSIYQIFLACNQFHT